MVYLVNTLLQIFHENVPVTKNLQIGQYLAKIWTKICGLVFLGAILYFVIWLRAIDNDGYSSAKLFIIISYRTIFTLILTI